MNLRPLKQDVVGDVGNVLWVLMGSIVMVLLVACANVANLLLDKSWRSAPHWAQVGSASPRICSSRAPSSEPWALYSASDLPTAH
jgi:hypothetical protein